MNYKKYGIGEREIKFRAWDGQKIVDLKTNVWDFDFEDGIGMLIGDEEAHFYEARKFVDNEKPIFMQYTGLKDKNGKEIYEGDIIDIHQTVNGESRFIISQGDIGTVAKYSYGRDYEYSIEELLEVNTPDGDCENEIIGNIFENPELITKK